MCLVKGPQASLRIMERELAGGGWAQYSVHECLYKGEVIYAESCQIVGILRTEPLQLYSSVVILENTAASCKRP